MELEQAVKFVRMNTGEDLITQITEVRMDDSNNYYILTNPMKLLYVTGGQTRPGMFSVNLMQWVFHRICEDQDFTIYPDDIVTIGNPTEDMIGYYWECVDSFYAKREENKKNTQYGDDFEDVNSDEESLEMLQELLQGITKPAKGTIH